MSEENSDSSALGRRHSVASDQQWSWHSWLQRAKDATSSTLTSVKRDLEEFGSAVVEQTSTAVDLAKSQSRSTSYWAKSVVNSVNDFLNDDQPADSVSGKKDSSRAETSPKTEHSWPTSNGPKTYKAYLRDIQSEPASYLNEPNGAPDLYEDWLDHFNLADKKLEIFQLLRYNRMVRKMYIKHVPENVSASSFWQRYFYAVHRLNLDRARHKSLTKLKQLAANEERDTCQSPRSESSEEEDDPPDDNNNSNNKSNLNACKSKSTSALSTVAVFSCARRRERFALGRFRRSPSLDIEIKLAESSSPEFFECDDAATDAVRAFGPVFDSVEEHTTYCRELCRSHGEHVETDD